MRKLIVEPVNGLMNRFRCIASAKILADYTGRDLLVNWKPEHVCNINLNQIVKDGFFSIGHDVDRNSCYYHSGYERLSEQSFIDEMVNTDDETLYLLAGGNFIPNGMSVSEFNNKKSDFYRSIPFVYSIMSEYEKFTTNNKDYVGLHLRYTDRRQWAPDIEYVEQIIKSENGQIFVCTDERNVLEYLKNKYGERIISYNVSSLNRNSVEGNVDSMIEWLILSNSSKIYYSLKSSYSYEACIYNKLSNSIEMNPNKIILDDLEIKLDF